MKTSDFDLAFPLNSFAKRIAKSVKARGFKTPTSIKNHNAVLAKLMLVSTEIAEAAEAVRKQDRANFDEEIIDVFIRLFDLAGAMKIDIDGGLTIKEAKNAGRPHKHGKVC